MSESERAEERARRRGRWPVKACRLGEEPPERLLERTTAAERWAMVWELTLAAWAFRDEPIPDRPRAEWPVRRLAPGESRD